MYWYIITDDLLRFNKSVELKIALLFATSNFHTGNVWTPEAGRIYPPHPDLKTAENGETSA